MNLKEKLTSRKFLLALVGIITGIVSIVKGEVVAGCSLMGSAIVGYLVAEGYVDAKAASAVLTPTEELLDIIADMTENQIDDAIVEALAEIIKRLEDGELIDN